jgi:hypothetical protein
MTILEAEQRKKIKALEKAIRGHLRTVYSVLDQLDAEMKKPSDHERGRRVANICNALDMSADAMLRFQFGYGWKRITRFKGAEVK